MSENYKIVHSTKDLFALADLRGAPGTPPPRSPNSFIFMQFLAKI